MKIDIKNLKVNDYSPYRNYNYEADLYVDNKKICKISSQGGVGNAIYSHVVKGRSIILKAAKEFCDHLPGKTVYLSFGFPKLLEGSLPSLVEDIIIQKYDITKPERDKLALAERMEQGIMIGHPDQPFETYRSIFIRETPIKYVMEDKTLRSEFNNFFQPLLRNIWEPGMVIFNTNLSKEDIEYLGIEGKMAPKATQKPRVVKAAQKNSQSRKTK